MPETLNSEEVNALMSAIEDGRVESQAERQPQIVPYDLTSQDRVIRGQMPTLDAIHESLASSFSTGLSGRTRLSLEVSSSPAALLKFADVHALLSPPALVAILALGPGHGQAILILEPGLVDSLLAAALGDRKVSVDDAPPADRRELTAVERAVLKRLLTLFTEGMEKAWALVLPFKPEVIRFETDPRLAYIAPANEAAILSGFEISGAFTGRLQLALPYSVVEPARKQLVASPRMGSMTDARFANNLANELKQCKVELRAVLGQAEVPVQRILELEVGDVLTLDTSESSALSVFVEGRLKLSGRPTVSSGALALVIEQGATNEAPRKKAS
ncbi:MAG: FliM/FliN family flagellar motor switch protein [Archangiaceae bacterium]|nr:FliM/FliN family flagellar motor switch protein [Archangiaceae bacterium]